MSLAARFARLATLLPALALCCAATAGPGSGLETAVAETRSLDQEQAFDGEVQAVHRSTLSARTSGEVVELPYDVNDYVPRGALVVRLDDHQQQAALDQATAEEARAAAKLAEAQSDFERKRKLLARHTISQSVFERAEASLKAARAELEAARARLAQAREQWEYTRVRAPFAGVMIERLVEMGEQVRPGAALATGLSLEQLRVEVAVPAHFAAAVRQTPRARVQAGDGRWVAADRIDLFPFADPASHSFTARVDLPQGQHGLFPGMLAKVAFRVGEKTALLIPERAIVHRSEVTGVYVVDDSGIRFRQLRTGRATDDGMRVVLAGLEAGERVALDPQAAVVALKSTVGTTPP
ncbi:MAG TPA: efflux RND transporter periplasmic adaptor subunit [Gammaproteobacteria bacterium]|nr:efflux RND transporter periplasmic adaptor subunit [Gammaproteobacteria bacterium]